MRGILMEPVKIPITDVIDLHVFRPDEVKDLLCDYFEACVAKGIFSVRVIHGKGQGVLKKRVCSLLKKHPQVKSFKDAPIESGGWGATIIELYSK
jgi:DNA-nicking Smr family endonuclease